MQSAKAEGRRHGSRAGRYSAPSNAVRRFSAKMLAWNSPCPRLARRPAEERCSPLFAHRRQQRPELPAVARQHRLDLGAVAQYHADVIDSDVLDPVKPADDPELKVNFVPRAL